MRTVYIWRAAYVAFVFTVLVAVYSISPIAEALNTYSVDFESSSTQFLSIADGSQTGLDGSANMTVEAWINFESLPSAGNNAAFVVKSVSFDDNRSYTFYYSGSDSKLRWVNQSDGFNGSDVAIDWTPSTGVWYHVAASKAGADISFFVNGLQLGSSQIGTSDVNNSTAPFRIGAHGNGEAYFDGKIDDVRVWNVARTPAEISDNMSVELTGNEPGLVGYWKLNGTLEDATANDNDLTDNNGAVFSTDTPFAEEEEINPVIVIPGILGSVQRHDVWVIDPILHTYDDLVATLDANGYTLAEDLFTFGYDWRNSNVATAQQLKAKIDDVKEICGCAKVDLIAHSMGGLVARQYMQSDAYENDVDQLIFLGTPHRGAPKAYLMWEGGAFVTPSVFDRLTQLFLKGDARKNGFDTAFEYLRGHLIAAVGELLPDYSYLFDSGALRAYPGTYPTNPFLASLNADIQTLLDAGSSLYSFVGDDHDTIVGVNVVPAPEKAPQWEHGYPENFDLKNTDRGLILGIGDQTVPLASASFVNENVTALDAKHGALPEDAAGDIVEILRGEPATTVVDDWNVPNIKLLVFQMFSPANLLITDPAGKRIGTTESGVDVNEIAGAFYAGPEAEREIITIPNPVPGIYTVAVRGTGSGTYTVESTYITDDAEDTVSRSGTTVSGKLMEYKVALHEDADPLEIAATIASTLADLEHAYVSGWLDTGAYHSLKAKLTVIQKLGGNSAAAKRALLKNIEDDLRKRRGKSVNNEAYQLLIEDVRSLLAAS